MSKKFICLAAVCLTLVVAGSAGAQVGKGQILFEYWDNIGGGTAITDLTNNALYPNSPTSSMWINKWEGLINRADNYGSRARAFLTPPADGDYTFYIATDDAGELWLSTDDTAANAKKIAFVAGWAGVDDWQNANEKANQKSAAITLKGGKNYFMMALEKEGGGGDNLGVGWTGPVIGTTIAVVDGKYCTAFIRTPEPLFKASAPSPANGAVEVTNPLFTWTAGLTAVSHDVYVGSSATLAAKDFMTNMPQPLYFHIAGLTPGAKYYWRVDEVDASGAKITGDVWSFTAQPLEAHNPSPYDGALWRKTALTLSWTAGQSAAKHRPYLSTDKAAVTTGAASAVKADQTAATLAVTGLTANSTYYWRVDELDGTGKVSAAGPVWMFTTVDAAGGAIAEYFNNNSLTGVPAKVTTVPEINFSWPDGTVKGTNSPDPAIQTDNFSARYTANLNVPVSGKYTLYDASDDGARLFLNGVQITNGWVNRGETEDASAPQDLVAGQSYILVMEYYEATGGAAARLRWSGPGIAKDIIPQGALQIPQVAISANPGNNAVEVPDTATLSWTGGPKAIVHTLYFGTDKAKVTASDKSVALAPSAAAKYVPPALLTWNTTYYWKVDEMGSDGVNVPGLVWSFTTANWVVVSGAQATLAYDNTKDPYMSQLAFDVTGDLTRGGVTDLALRFLGVAKPVGGVVYNDANQAYVVTGSGTDIWNNADQFRYVYKTLTGDGTMIARVVSIGPGANTWAKGGVMIRQSLSADSMHAIMAMTANSDGTAGNGSSFQRRLATAGASSNSDSPVLVKCPYWVKIQRKGTAFSGFYSPDGKTWTQVGADVTIPMVDPVLIGLPVVSHVDAATTRTVTFDNVSTTGTVVPAGPFSATDDIGMTSNDPSTLYVAVQDAAGKMAMVTNANPAAVNTTVWDLWRVPMSAFTGVDLTKAKTLYIGVGNGKPDGSGTMNFADVRILMPVVLPDPKATDVTTKGDPLNGFPNYAGAWPAAEVPANAIDNSVATKYLNFANVAGKTTMPCGFSVTPSLGASIVTGLTFTTANDAQERDPIAWQIQGSNGTIDGPWETIASGTIDDFGRPIDWPRQWKGVTPIGFANTLPFLSYKVSFTAVKRPAAANSMQIAEVELLGVPVKVTAKANPIITKVVRVGGYTETRDPVGSHDGATAPLPMGLGGIMDGNMIYSDRTYPFNQTPASMVGIEYVRIFQSDKNVNTVSYTVTFSKAATIVLAHDDRNTPAQAAVDMVTAAFAKAGTFKPTSTSLFCYESASVPARPFTVFTADFPAGTYVFAAEPSSNAMYILGAK